MRAALAAVTPLPLGAPRPTALRAALRLAAVAVVAGCTAAPQATPGAGTPAPVAPGTGSVQVDTGRPAPVALLVPSASAVSSHQAVARDVEDAVRMAAEDMAGRAPISLSVIPTDATAAGAATATERAVAGGAVAVIGPVFAEEAMAVAPAAARTGTPVLSISSFAGAASPPVYVLGFTPEDEVARIMAYAASQGLRRIALLHPQTSYGEVARAAVVAEAPRNGQSVVSITAYPRNFPGVQSTVGSASGSIAAASPDAVLVADAQEALLSVMTFLALADLTPARLPVLGLMAWEEGRVLRNPELRGGWFASVDPEARQAFRTRFQSRHGREPLSQAIIAYDAVAALASALGEARQTGSTTPFEASRMTSPVGFEGASGRFRIGADGTARRSLAVMEVGATGPVLRAPPAAPGS